MGASAGAAVLVLAACDSSVRFGGTFGVADDGSLPALGQSSTPFAP